MPRLVLENSAGTGDGIGASLEDLADITRRRGRGAVWPMDSLGVCLDTAHLWGAGYDLSMTRRVDDLVGRIDELVGRENVVMLHLNDSRTVRGSHLDRHEHIGAGQLGADRHARAADSPVADDPADLPRDAGYGHRYDAVNLDRVRLVIDGETPPQLPPEAFAAARFTPRTRRRTLMTLNPVVRDGAVPRAYIEQQSRTG